MTKTLPYWAWHGSLNLQPAECEMIKLVRKLRDIFFGFLAGGELITTPVYAGTHILSAAIIVAAAFYNVGLAVGVAAIGLLYATRCGALWAMLGQTRQARTAEASRARLFALTSAEVAEGVVFIDATRGCLKHVCEARGWCAAHVWQTSASGDLVSHGLTYFAPAVQTTWPKSFHLDVASTHLAARIAANTHGPIVGIDFAQDPRFAGPDSALPQAVVAWPVEIESRVDLVIEFFSFEPIILDDLMHDLLRHVALQISHVRTREIVREHAERLAFTDVITGMPNRAGFEHLFGQKLRDARRENTRIALMFVDLDGFKRVNDSLGHAIGDSLLRTVGERLARHLRPSDVTAKLDNSRDTLAARLGGDEFTLVLSGLIDADGASIVAQRFLDILAEPIDVGVQEVNIGASIGIAMFPDDGKSLSDLMRLADAAMYDAKALPGSQFRFATPALNDAIKRRLWIENELRHAICKDEIRLAYAPIVSPNSGKLIANEVTLRWPHRDGEIAFKEFFAVAETSNVIFDLGYWAIEQTCAAIAAHRWHASSTVKLCLDISLTQLQQPSFYEEVALILQRYDVPRGALEFEFSETSAILKNEICRSNIRRLHEAGVRIVLDKFGTGYSSLLDLSELPVWRIKLDRSFVEAVQISDESRSMGRAIIAMAHSMGVETTVFNVCTAEQAQKLRELGCDAIQGPWVGRASSTPVSIGAADRSITGPRAVMLDDIS